MLRTDTSGNPTWHELLGRISETNLNAYANQDLPFERLVEILNPSRSNGRLPLFQILLSLHGATPEPAFPGLVARGEALDRIVQNKFDLAIHLREAFDEDGAPAGLDGMVEYSTDLFDEAAVEQLSDHLVRLLSAMATDPGQRIGAAELLDPAGRERVVRTWNDTAHEVPRTTLPELFAAQAARTPYSTAGGVRGRLTDLQPTGPAGGPTRPAAGRTRCRPRAVRRGRAAGASKPWSSRCWPC